MCTENNTNQDSFIMTYITFKKFAIKKIESKKTDNQIRIIFVTCKEQKNI